MAKETTPEPLRFSETLIVGENDHYQFGVGLCGQRWIGFALGRLDDGNRMMFVLPEVSVEHELGHLHRDSAILLTTAVANDVESAYGGIDFYHVPPELRGDPEKLRCGKCEQIHAGPCDEYFDDDGGPW